MKFTHVALGAMAVALAGCATVPAEDTAAVVAEEPEVVETLVTQFGEYPLTPVGAQDFIAAVETQLERDHVADRQAMWLNETNITIDSDGNRAYIDAVIADRRARFAAHAVRFAGLDGLAPDVARKAMKADQQGSPAVTSRLECMNLDDGAGHDEIALAFAGRERGAGGRRHCHHGDQEAEHMACPPHRK